MIPPIPQNDGRLTETVRPLGWENLGGPFQWFDIVSTDFEDHTEYGKTIRVKTRGKMGTLAEGFAINKESPFPNILFCGPPGTGKSATQQLIVRTHLAKEHKAVTYVVGQDQPNAKRGDVVTLINNRTGEPFMLNPVDDKTSSIERVAQTIRHASDDVGQAIERNPYLQFFNAAPLRKEGIDQLVRSIRGTKMPTMSGKAPRRAVIISEFDNLRKDQVPSLKSGIDPLTYPPGLLMLFDTNHIEKVRQRVDAAGMRRFEIFAIGRWTEDALASYLRNYRAYYGITFDPKSFEAENVHPGRLILHRADGSIRTLLQTIEKLRTPDGKATHAYTYEELAELLSEEDYQESESSSAAWEFIDQVTNRNKYQKEHIIRFCKKMGLKRLAPPLAPFARSLGRYVLDSYTHALGFPGVQDGLQTLFYYSAHEGEPMQELMWATLVEPLTDIAYGIQQKQRS